MKRLLRAGALTLALLLLSTAASAGGCFGSGEKLYFVAPVALTTADGGNLDLARKYTRWCFFFPFAQRDGGFVLRLRSDHSRYLDMPARADVERFQKAGLLPNPLPAWQQDWVYFIFDGYFLWIMVAALLVYCGYIVRKIRREQAAA